MFCQYSMFFARAGSLQAAVTAERKKETPPKYFLTNSFQIYMPKKLDGKKIVILKNCKSNTFLLLFFLNYL